jgi:hypothetical protein
MFPSRILSPRQETTSSMPSCGCHPLASAPATSCSWISTVFSTLFGVDESLARFWRNIVTAT